MSKRSYIFRYTVSNANGLIVSTHKIRAMSEQEAYSRFKQWSKFHPIIEYELEERYKDTNYIQEADV